MTEQMMATLLGQLGVAGTLAFFMWHLISKSVPDLIAGFRAELNEERAARREQNQAIIASIDRLTAHLDNLTERIERMTAWRKPRTDIHKEEAR